MGVLCLGLGLQGFLINNCRYAGAESTPGPDDHIGRTVPNCGYARGWSTICSFDSRLTSF